VTTGRIAVGAAAGEAQRSLAQQIKDAIFTRKQQQFGFETTGRANIASLLFESRTPVISGGGPSELGKIANVASDIASIGGSVAGIAGGFGNLLSGPKQTATKKVAAPALPTGTLAANQNLFSNLFLGN
ncbi:hypothetical protein LCGC14_1736580, partial [marine sediment metagenome]